MSTSTSNMFKVSDLTPKVAKSKSIPFQMRGHPVTHLKSYDEHKCIRILQGTEFHENVHSLNNGFIQTVLNAYNGHHNLVIRPDDVWTAIVTQFSFYVKANAEKFNQLNFPESEEIILGILGRLSSAPYDLYVKAIKEEIYANLEDQDFKYWLLPDFTTTTLDDTITCGVIFMGSACSNNYLPYSYKSALSYDGIPLITLEGNFEDWKKIQGRLEKLKTFGLEDWVNLLEPIIHEFIQAKLGNHNEDFWQTICHYESFDSESEGQQSLCGWLSTFSFFDENGKRQGYIDGTSPWLHIFMKNLASAVVQVDIKIIDNRSIHQAVIFAGHMAGEILENRKFLQPKLGWAIALKPDEEED